MVCAPNARLEVLNVACAPEAAALSVAVPRVVLPSRNVTVPVGVPSLAPVTAAVNVTDWPGAARFVDADTEVVVLTGCTVSLNVADELPMNVPLPL